jgi:hypothetical protein
VKLEPNQPPVPLFTDFSDNWICGNRLYLLAPYLQYRHLATNEAIHLPFVIEFPLGNFKAGCNAERGDIRSEATAVSLPHIIQKLTTLIYWSLMFNRVGLVVAHNINLSLHPLLGLRILEHLTLLQ